ncbi:SRPBCC family protein [Gracilibacillus kekensis]|uniref:Activator of Hsp90 ATPase homolog 1-like protein n=1 Tax=Gracilibacillus kekensis TaxID=1027249 RepID=A0A1M7KFW0_9BACI|nr:SRPBCC domain-containing protein [Gracilibacillus kekensis]SHM64110.1 Activator of Hsp90 ATPase homolog 1-like protein [Gracilibacillus kekensis]
MSSIEHFQVINRPVQHVYEVLTTKKGLSEIWTNDLHFINEIGAINVFRFGEGDESKIRVEELVVDKEIVWKCIESDESEWINTIISFDLKENNQKTEIIFRHTNWQDITTCYRSCNYNWAIFLYSLKQYCEEGKGMPYQKRTISDIT